MTPVLRLISAAALESPISITSSTAVPNPASNQIWVIAHHGNITTNGSENWIGGDISPTHSYPTPQPYQASRYGMGMCALMGVAWGPDVAYSNDWSRWPYFEEYDCAATMTAGWLGPAIDPPFPGARADGTYVRRFTNGVVIVNPWKNGAKSTSLNFATVAITGTQPYNNGAAYASGAPIALLDRDAIFLKIGSSGGGGGGSAGSIAVAQEVFSSYNNSGSTAHPSVTISNVQAGSTLIIWYIAGTNQNVNSVSGIPGITALLEHPNETTSARAAWVYTAANMAAGNYTATFNLLFADTRGSFGITEIKNATAAGLDGHISNAQSAPALSSNSITTGSGAASTNPHRRVGDHLSARPERIGDCRHGVQSGLGDCGRREPGRHHRYRVQDHHRKSGASGHVHPDRRRRGLSGAHQCRWSCHLEHGAEHHLHSRGCGAVL